MEKRQVGDWKVFEDECFMMVIVSVLGDRFKVGSVGAYRVEGVGYSTYSWLLVAGKEGKLAEIEELRLENEVILGPVP